MAKELVFDVEANGTMSFIHNDSLSTLIAGENAKISRASNVEPGDASKGQDPLKWYVDFAPLGRPEILGPFVTREVALIEEHDWLVEHGLPLPTETKAWLSLQTK